jgi:ComF family protein
LLELLFPTRCAACGVPGALLCPDCRRQLTQLRPPLCARCGAPTAWPVARCSECSGRRLPFTSARAAVSYTGPTRALVRAWKERGLRLVAPLAGELVAECVPRPPADVITYIPPDGDRSLRRGHQPARDLAAALGERWRLPVACLLTRTRTVARQTGLPRTERRRNVHGAFTAARADVPARVVLVDDVYTTGATVAAAASALRAAGARDVYVVTLARTVR